MPSDMQRNARAFKAFCDENRLLIIRLLAGGERCACKLQDDLSISQPTLSHHMRILCDAGVVSARRDGKWMYYTLDQEGCVQAVESLQEVLGLKTNPG